jgi:hypothetical protein
VASVSGTACRCRKRYCLTIAPGGTNLGSSWRAGSSSRCSRLWGRGRVAVNSFERLSRRGFNHEP